MTAFEDFQFDISHIKRTSNVQHICRINLDHIVRRQASQHHFYIRDFAFDADFIRYRRTFRRTGRTEMAFLRAVLLPWFVGSQHTVPPRCRWKVRFCGRLPTASRAFATCRE